VLNESLKGRRWLTGDTPTIADFSVGGLVPSAERLQLPVAGFPELQRWYRGLASLEGWKAAVDARQAALAALVNRQPSHETSRH
jgi:glutathione S-transferase